jgi:hypothetical protein
MSYPAPKNQKAATISWHMQFPPAVCRRVRSVYDAPQTTTEERRAVDMDGRAPTVVRKLARQLAAGIHLPNPEENLPYSIFTDASHWCVNINQWRRAVRDINRVAILITY